MPERKIYGQQAENRVLVPHKLKRHNRHKSCGAIWRYWVERKRFKGWHQITAKAGGFTPPNGTIKQTQNCRRGIDEF